MGRNTAAFFLLMSAATLVAQQDFPGAEVTKLVDGAYDEPSSHWAFQGSPAHAVVTLDSPSFVNKINVFPFAGNSNYYYNDSWKVQYVDTAGSLQDFTGVQKLTGAGNLVADAGIFVTEGSPGVSSSVPEYKEYQFKFNPVTVSQVVYTVLIGDRDGDSNGAELEVYKAWTTEDVVPLQAESIDAQDGDISSSVEWSSSIDGSLGSGASINVSLSAGTHTITAKSVNSLDLETTETFVIEILNVPVE